MNKEQALYISFEALLEKDPALSRRDTVSDSLVMGMVVSDSECRPLSLKLTVAASTHLAMPYSFTQHCESFQTVNDVHMLECPCTTNEPIEIESSHYLMFLQREVYVVRNSETNTRIECPETLSSVSLGEHDRQR